jgi:hypothetical protein
MTKKRRERRGAILLLIAVSMIALMSLLVLAADGGLIQRERRIAQMAADAAAQGGAIEIFRNRPESTIVTARGEATRNRFTTGVRGVNVVVTYPNTIGTKTGPNFVHVLIQDTVRTFFGSLIGRSKVVVNARSVGGVTGTTQSCIVSLDPDDSHALIVESGGHVSTQNCNVQVNSNSSTALCVTASEGGYLDAGTGTISVTGGYDSGCRGTVSPTATTGQTPAADPLASLAVLNVSDTSGACRAPYGVYTVTTDETINPGIYCGGIKAGKSTSIVRMNPGLYVIKGGGLSVSGGGTVIGTGVNIVNLNAPAANGGAAKFDVIDFGSDAVISLSAKTDGNLAGLVFYSPPGQGVAGHVIQNQITSAASATITGSLYFPDQQVRLGSGGTLTIAGGVVAGVVLFRSDSRVNVTGFAGASPYSVRQASVVE